MRELEQSAERGDKRATLAVRMFVERTAAGIAAIATALPRVDALVFTGGIGEHSAAVRNGVVERLATTSIGQVLTVEAREDVVVAMQTEALLSR
jgi:acetate kinase